MVAHFGDVAIVSRTKDFAGGDYLDKLRASHPGIEAVAETRTRNEFSRPGAKTPNKVDLRLQKGQQVGIDRFRLSGWHAMRKALIGLQRAVL
jgi:hypothetical protein